MNFKNDNNARPEDLPALVLAYVGDAVYELAVRERLIGAGLVKVNQLHSETVKYVNAGAQARALHALEGKLTGDEASIVRRGRNPKSAPPGGWWAVVGWSRRSGGCGAFWRCAPASLSTPRPR